MRDIAGKGAFPPTPAVWPFRDLCNSITARTDLVVHLQRLALSFGVEVLRVGVHRQVDLPVEALDVNRVPVLVVQQAAHRDGNAAAAAAPAKPLPVIVCGRGRGEKREKKNHMNRALSDAPLPEVRQRKRNNKKTTKRGRFIPETTEKKIIIAGIRSLHASERLITENARWQERLRSSSDSSRKSIGCTCESKATADTRRQRVRQWRRHPG